jgi:hypothetical protein
MLFFQNASENAQKLSDAVAVKMVQFLEGEAKKRQRAAVWWSELVGGRLVMAKGGACANRAE